MKLTPRHICPICGKVKREPGKLGAVSHPECSRILQEMHKSDKGRKTTLTPRLTESAIDFLSTWGKP